MNKTHAFLLFYALMAISGLAVIWVTGSIWDAAWYAYILACGFLIRGHLTQLDISHAIKEIKSDRPKKPVRLFNADVQVEGEPRKTETGNSSELGWDRRS